MSFDNDAEREEYQRRSDAYQPDVVGPLVKPRESITTLITEYENADQTFRTKIATLSRDHSMWRPIKGDGKCGWTASVFAYLETLLSLRDAAKVQTEIARIRAFESGLRALGYDLSIVEFAWEGTFQLLQDLHDNIITGNGRETLILDAFKDDYLASSIIYHFKLMTSAFMQLNPDIYSPFVDRPLDEYCRNVVEPQVQEIENASLQALATGVIGPAGFAFDVLYLDRSTGDQVTPHHIYGENTNFPLITLLYRPGHYDIIYKDITPVQVNFHHRLPELAPNYASEEFFAGVDATSLISPDASLVTGYTLSSAPYIAPSYHRQYSGYSQTYGSSNASTPPTDLSAVSEESSLLQVPPVSEDRIRFNPYTFQTDPNGQLTTPVFKNSPFNPNHFRNSNFNPQQYNPDEQVHRPRTRRQNSATKPTTRPRTNRQSVPRKHK